MQKTDGYVRRFKSLSLVMVATGLLSYNVADSDSRLRTDFSEIEGLFFASTLLSAYVPRNARITAVDGAAAQEWLDRSEPLSEHGVLPSSGILVDVVRLWDTPESTIEGSIALSNGETLLFVRHPAGNADGARQGNACSSNNEECGTYSLSPGGPLRTEITLYRSVEDGQWRFFAPGTGVPMTIGSANSAIVQTAANWSGTPSNAEDAYFDVRQMVARRNVRIPLVNVDVDASSAALFLAIFALAAAALIAHSLLVLRSVPDLGLDEPWIVLLPANRQVGWLARLQLALSWSGAVVLLLVVFVPAAVIWFSIRMTDSGSSAAVLIVLLIATLALASSSAAALVSIVRSIHGKSRTT